MASLQPVVTHPQANAQSTSAGETIHVLREHEGKLYAGYGDQKQNTGPIDINPFDMASESFDGVVHTAMTEAILEYRSAWGLVAPHADPRGTDPDYSDLVSGSWASRNPFAGLHVYDLAGPFTVGGVTRSLLTGSKNNGAGTGPARCWMTGVSAGHRYHLAFVYDGELYTQSYRPTSGGSSYKYSKWDNTLQKWTQPALAVDLLPPADTPRPSYEDDYVIGCRPVIFDDEVWYLTHCSGLSSTSNPDLTGPGRLLHFDGLSVSGARPGERFWDICVDAGTLYLLRDDGKVLSLGTTGSWTLVIDTPLTAARSICIADGYLLAGATDSGLYKSSIPV